MSTDAGHLSVIQLQNPQRGETSFLGGNRAVLDGVGVVPASAAFGTSVIPQNRTSDASVRILQAVGPRCGVT